MVVVPQPVLNVMLEPLLVNGVTVRGAVPVNVKIIGAIVPSATMLCVAPEVMVIVGGAAVVTVTGTCTD